MISCLDRLVDNHGERLDRARGEQVSKWKSDLKGLGDLGDDLGREQRMPAKIKEVVADADTVDAQNLRPYLREALLGWCVGRDVRVFQVSSTLRGRERFSIDLPVGEPGQLFELNEVCGHHVVGELYSAGPSELGGAHGAFSRTHHVGDQLLVRGQVLSGDDDGLSDGVFVGEDGLDLTWFDAKSPELHLMVCSSQELDLSVRQSPCDVSGLVESFALGANGWGKNRCAVSPGRPR